MKLCGPEELHLMTSSGGTERLENEYTRKLKPNQSNIRKGGKGHSSITHGQNYDLFFLLGLTSVLWELGRE